MNEYKESYDYTIQPQREAEPEWTLLEGENAPKNGGKRQKKGTGRVLALVLCCALAGGAMGAGGALLAGRNAQGKQNEPEKVTALMEGVRDTAALQVVPVNTGKLLTPAEVYAANVQSTVGITTSVTTNFWGYQTTSAASGSGFIISSDGYILTNYHVVENSNGIKVSLYDGTAYDAKLIGYDESNDIAVLKVDAAGLSPVILGDSDKLNVGENVVAIGNPLGELTFSLTAGYVSAKDRQVTLSGGVTMNLIQTDTAINSGNSGGALFNLYGEVIGITNAKYSGSSASSASIDNIGFAIPINSVRSIVESIIEKGYIVKPYIGVSINSVGSEAQLYGLPQGAVILATTEDGPAQAAGLKQGDIVTGVNGTAVTGSSDLKKLVSAAKPGDVLTLSVYRQGENLSITLTVQEQIQDALAQEEAVPQERQEIPSLPRQFGR